MVASDLCELVQNTYLFLSLTPRNTARTTSCALVWCVLSFPSFGDTFGATIPFWVKIINNAIRPLDTGHGNPVSYITKIVGIDYIMKVSTGTRYSIRALVDIAIHHTEGPMSIGLLAQRLGISKHFLENLMLILKRNDIVIASRGSRGGYALARHPADIRLSEVFTAIEGSEPLVCCTNCPSDCPFADHCSSHDLLVFLDKAIVSALSSVTLESMVKQQALRTLY